MLRDFDFPGERMALSARDGAEPKRAAVRGRGGKIIHFPCDDPIGRAMKLYGEWAQIEIDFLCGLIGRGSTVLDVGAHIGTHSIAFSERVGPMGAVRAFEPQAAVFDLLRCNLASSGSANVAAAPLAVADRAGELAAPDEGDIALLSPRSSRDEPGSTVRAIAIDDLELDRCDLVKIDVEGMEPLVIKGMSGTISRLQPLIYCDCKTIEAGVDLLRLLPPSYRAFLVRCPAFNENNALEASDNVFGHACETSLLFAPSGVAHPAFCFLLGCVEIITIDTMEDLAKAIVATPRHGDASRFARDPETLNRELRTLVADLSEQNSNLLRASQSPTCATREVDELRASLRTVEETKQALHDRVDGLLTALDLKEGEIARLQFRSEYLTTCLRRVEDKLDRAGEARDLAVRDLSGVREELDAARRKIEADREDFAKHRDDLACLLSRSDEQTARLAAVHDELAKRTSGVDAVMQELAQLRQDVRDGSQQRAACEGEGRRPRFRILTSIRKSPRDEYEQIAASGLFDRQWYLAGNRDVAGSGVDPLVHYLREGALENRDPGPHFSTGRYLAGNPDVARSGLNPLAHYIRHGRREGRAVAPSEASGVVAP